MDIPERSILFETCYGCSSRKIRYETGLSFSNKKRMSESNHLEIPLDFLLLNCLGKWAMADRPETYIKHDFLSDLK